MPKIEEIYSHLKDYKEKTLCISEQGIYVYRKKKLAKSYILPDKDTEKNLLDSGYFLEEKKVYEDLKSQNRIHRYFRHLNSSQALALNLFVPVIEENLYSSLFCIDGIKIQNPEFEHIEKKSFEDKFSGFRKTNFDFFVQSGNEKFFFEVKYSEKDFGKAASDEIHKQKFQEIYLPELKEICTKEGLQEIDEKRFLKEYQLWRILCHVRYGGVYFAVPEFRSDLKSKVESARSVIKKEYQDKIHILVIDEFVEKMISKGEAEGNEKISGHYKEFKKKYLEL